MAERVNDLIWWDEGRKDRIYRKKIHGANEMSTTRFLVMKARRTSRSPVVWAILALASSVSGCGRSRIDTGEFSQSDSGGEEFEVAVAGALSDDEDKGHGTPGVSAAKLVRAVRESENWIHRVDSLFIRIESAWTRKPEAIAITRAGLEKQFPEMELNPKKHWDLKPSSKGTLEYAIDSQRLMWLEDTSGESRRVNIWDGKLAIAHIKDFAEEREHYYFDVTPQSIADGMFGSVSWPRTQPHSFWWNPTDVKKNMKNWGLAEDFVLLGRSQYHGVQCFVLHCASPEERGIAWRWYVGVQDRRLCGMVMISQVSQKKWVSSIGHWITKRLRPAVGFL